LFRQSDVRIETILPFVRAEAEHIFHQYVVRLPEHRDAVMKYLAQCGVGTKVYYPIPMHMQPCFASLGYKEGDFPEAENAARQTMALPCFPELTEEQQQYVVDVLARFSV
jgi:dTDP-4-amino-4,6-dideoxygalactose transaminase